MNRIHSASFTLVELLIVIGILAILTSVIVLILNPAELLRQSRDTTRMSDLASIHTALSLYLTQSTQPSLGTASTIYISLPDTSPTCINLSLPTLPSGYTYACVSHASSSLINGSGWLPINLASSSIGSLPKLPLDPTNTTSSGLYYTYTTNGTQYELTTILESTKYRLGGSQDKVSHDGGSTSYLYEQGTNMTLNPLNDTGLVGYWTFDEGSGNTAYDTSGYGNHGTWSGILTWQSQSNCKVGGCLGFNLGHITVPDVSSLNFSGDFSVGVWMYYDQISNWNVLIAKEIWGSSQGWAFLYINNDSTLGYYNTVLGGTVLATNIRKEWHNVFSVMKSGTVSLYIDGILVKANNPGTFSNASVPLYIGARHMNDGSSYTDRFYGKLDDVRVYNKALSEAEIKALYNATK